MASNDARQRSSVAAAFQAGTSTLTKGAIDPSVLETISAVIPAAVIDSTRTPPPHRMAATRPSPMSHRDRRSGRDGQRSIECWRFPRSSRRCLDTDRIPSLRRQQTAYPPINFNRTVTRTEDANRSGAFLRPTRINWQWRRRDTARGPPSHPILPRKTRDVSRLRRGLRAVGERRRSSVRVGSGARCRPRTARRCRRADS